MKIDSLIFDLDGTLWDACRVVYESWNKTLRERYGRLDAPSFEAVKGIMGLTPEDISDLLFSDFGDKRREVCIQCLRDEPVYMAEHCGELYPGVVEMLRRLSVEYKLYIVSNCIFGYIECFLKGSGTEKYISSYLCQEDTGLSKGENIAKLIRDHGLEHPIYIGDTLSDEKSAGEGGCGFIHAAYGFGEARGPIAVIHEPMELIAVLNSLKEGGCHG